MLGLKFIHVSKSGSLRQFALNEYICMHSVSNYLYHIYREYGLCYKHRLFCILYFSRRHGFTWILMFNMMKYHDTLFPDDVIKWKHFTRYWPFVRGIHRSPVNSPHKGQWRWALMFSLICAWINGWVNNLEAIDWRRPSCPLWRHWNAHFQWCRS